MSKQHVRLVMIVRDEAEFIEKCLTSYRGLFDSWTIVDTGSKDDTMEIVRKTLDGVPGTLDERPWKNHTVNRDQALELARADGVADYLFLIDSDWTYPNPDFRWPKLGPHTGYRIPHRMGATLWWLPGLLRADAPWAYSKDPKHATPQLPHDFPAGDLPKMAMEPHGVKSRPTRGFGDHSEKFKEDVAILSKSDKPRDVFYCAQAYRDLGDIENALEWYEKRAAMKGFEEERWFALYQIAVLEERMGDEQAYPSAIVREAYLRAYRARPQRAESLCYLAAYCRKKKDRADAFMYAITAANTPLPQNDVLFLDATVYEWRSLDELSQAAHWLGYGTIANKCYENLSLKWLKNPGIMPPPAIERIKSNWALFRKQLAQNVAA